MVLASDIEDEESEDEEMMTEDKACMTDETLVSTKGGGQQQHQQAAVELQPIRILNGRIFQQVQDILVVWKVQQNIVQHHTNNNTYSTIDFPARKSSASAKLNRPRNILSNTPKPMPTVSDRSVTVSLVVTSNINPTTA